MLSGPWWGKRGGAHGHVRNRGELLGNVVCMLDVFHHCRVDGNVYLCGGSGADRCYLLLLLALDEPYLSVLIRFIAIEVAGVAVGAV